MSITESIFLSEDWVHRVVGAIEHSKSTDENVRTLASDFQHPPASNGQCVNYVSSVNRSDYTRRESDGAGN